MFEDRIEGKGLIFIIRLGIDYIILKGWFYVFLYSRWWKSGLFNVGLNYWGWRFWGGYRRSWGWFIFRVINGNF